MESGRPGPEPAVCGGTGKCGAGGVHAGTGGNQRGDRGAEAGDVLPHGEPADFRGGAVAGGEGTETGHPHGDAGAGGNGPAEGGGRPVQRDEEDEQPGQLGTPVAAHGGAL